MRVPPYAKFVLAIFAGLVVCGGYITGADLLCPVEKQGPLSIDDLQVYQRPQRENQARNQRDNQGISQKSRSIGSIFTPLQANAEQPPTKGQSDDKNHQPRKWVSIQLNSEGGHSIGARAQLLLFLDDLLPSLFGKPLLSR